MSEVSEDILIRFVREIVKLNIYIYIYIYHNKEKVESYMVKKYNKL
jgi:hypothetical protein